MKNLKSRIALMMAMTMISGANSMAFASAETGPVPTLYNGESKEVTAQKEVRSTLEGVATVEQVNGEKQLTVKIDQQTIVLNIGEETLFIDANTGIPSSLKDLKAGDSVYVYYSAAMTRSLPPQSSAVAVVTGVEKDKTIPRLMTVKEIVDSKENQIRFLNTDEDMIVTILKDNPITPYKTKQIVTYKDIQAGSKVFVWYDIVAMSYPGQTAAKKTVLVSTADTAVKAPVKVSVNGKALELGQSAVIERNGVYMVPLKAVSKALSFDLKWDAKTKSASIDNEMVKTTVTVGQDSYYKASSKAIGLTAPFAYGAGPEIIDGTLYVPADLFNLLYSNEETVKVIGDILSITASEK